MKGIDKKFLGELIILCAIVVVALMTFVLPASGFDVKKYFGLEPILGEPGNPEFPGMDRIKTEELTTICGKFLKWEWTNVKSSCFDSEDVHVCTFQSDNCETGVPVSCSTNTNGFDDTLISMYIEEGHCKFVTTGSEHTRDVGVLCANLTPSEVEYKWGEPETASSGTQISIGSSVGCSPGFTSISGMVMGSVSTEDDVDDRLTYLSRANAGILRTGSINKAYGKVCIKESISNFCALRAYNFPISVVTNTMDTKSYDVGSHDQPCPGDSQLIFCGGGYIDPSSYSSSILSYFSTSLHNDRNDNLDIKDCKILSSESKDINMTILCARNLWQWSSWSSSGSSYPSWSITCTNGTAIACASDTASLEDGYKDEGSPGILGVGAEAGGGNYGEDALNSFYFTNDHKGCIIRARDENDVSEHKRRVGALCIDSTLYASDFTSPAEKRFTQSSGNNYVEAESEPCSSGYYPVFCTIKLNSIIGEAYYEDEISAIDIKNNKCVFTLADPKGDKEFDARVGVLCAKDTSVLIKNDWDGELKNFWSPRIDFESPFFKSQSCPVGIATMPLTITQSDDSMKEDFLISMVPTSSKNSFVIQAEDSTGFPTYIFDQKTGTGNEHVRKVGTICLNYPESVFNPGGFKEKVCSDIGGCDRTSLCRPADGLHCSYVQLGCSGTIPCCCIPSTTPDYCGNGVCDTGETQSNCCIDCNCLAGKICKGKNVCV